MATIPKMVFKYISKKKIISMIGCLLKICFFHSLGDSEGMLLTTVAIDRYVTICNPLCYPTIMTPSCVRSSLQLSLTFLCFPQRLHGFPR